MHKKRIGIFVILIFLFTIYTYSFFSEQKNNKDSKSVQEPEYRKVVNNAFTYGERFDYKVIYSFITAGTGYFAISPKPLYRGNKRPCYDIMFSVESLKSLAFLYRIKNWYKSVIDEEGIFPWEFEQHNRENDYKRDFKAVFNHAKNLAIVGDKSYTIPPMVHDLVSAFYYVRTMNIGSMRKDSVFFLQNFYDDQTYSLGVKILGKQVVNVEAGKFKCILVEPLVVKGGLFKSEGNIIIWLSDDENKIPIKVAAKIPIGYVSAELTSYSGLKNPPKAKLN